MTICTLVMSKPRKGELCERDEYKYCEAYPSNVGKHKCNKCKREKEYATESTRESQQIRQNQTVLLLAFSFNASNVYIFIVG